MATLPFVILDLYPVASALSCLAVGAQSIRSRQTTPPSYFNNGRDMAGFVVRGTHDLRRGSVPMRLRSRNGGRSFGVVNLKDGGIISTGVNAIAATSNAQARPGFLKHCTQTECIVILFGDVIGMQLGLVLNVPRV
jgi:hypothetical protein